jgi:hypothetical protein
MFTSSNDQTAKRCPDCCRENRDHRLDRTPPVRETIHNEPFEVHADMVADAIRAADALGRAWKKHNGEPRSK